MSKLLLVEDDVFLSKNIRLLLEKSEYEVITAASVEAAKCHVDADVNDMYLIDVMLPDGNGFELCQYIRKCSAKPIIMISAKDDEDSIVRGLELGADDYVTKPFKPNEFLSRIKANMRRVNLQINCRVYVSADIEIDFDKRTVLKGGREISLRKLEYELLEEFIRHPQIVIKRDVILNAIWDREGNFIEDNTLSVSIKRLREKLGERFGGGSYIETIRGVGYRWNPTVTAK